MKIFILSHIKINELESKNTLGDQLCEDLIDVLKYHSTCVIDNLEDAIRKFESEPELYYMYEVDMARRLL